MTDEHLVPLPGTPWQVWRSAVLRSAGFPAAGITRFAAHDLAVVADRFIDGTAGPDELAAAFDASLRELGSAVRAVAADPAFRTAVTWQNPDLLPILDSILRDVPDAPRNQRRRRREEIVAKYWQRFCLKNDTIGFYGPMCWTTVDPGAPAVTVRPGPGLVRDRWVFLEWWALVALGERVAAQPGVEPWLPVRMQPQVTVRGRELLVPNRPAQRLASPTVALLALAARRLRAADIAAALVADPDSSFRREQDVHAQLAELADRGILRIGFDLPIDLGAERHLRAQLLDIGDPALRAWAVGELDALGALRDAVAAATDPNDLATALAALDRRFVDVTGVDSARRRPGQVYAGRTLCHLETTRDVEVTFGDEVMRRLAPLKPLLHSTRWLTTTLARAYTAALGDLYRDLASDNPDAGVGLADLWFHAQDMVFGADSPAGPVTAEFLDRWRDVLGLVDAPAGLRELRLDAAELGKRVTEAFPGEAPGWGAARLHSPDVHLCAADPQALARGEFTVVLGEMHIGIPTFDTQLFTLGLPDPAGLPAGLAADLPAGRILLLTPPDWPRITARGAEWMYTPRDAHLAFTAAPRRDPDLAVPITALTVVAGPDGLTVRGDDGRQWGLVDVFADLIGYQILDTWKLVGNAAHTPRVSVGDLVLVRETWRTTVTATGLTEVIDERERYLAVRQWRRALGLPEQVFVRVASELKPSYVDLTSPVYCRLLCMMLRAARAKAGDGAAVTVTELLPGPGDAWLTDAAGRGYVSELRLQIRDPALAGTR